MNATCLYLKENKRSVSDCISFLRPNHFQSNVSLKTSFRCGNVKIKSFRVENGNDYCINSFEERPREWATSYSNSMAAHADRQAFDLAEAPEAPQAPSSSSDIQDCLRNCLEHCTHIGHGLWDWEAGGQEGRWPAIPSEIQTRPSSRRQ